MDDGPDDRCHVTGKRRFESEAAARSRMRRHRNGRRRLPSRLRAYKCPHCHGWHLSNPEKA